MSKKKVVVHCGMTKTGSTAIQLFLRNEGIPDSFSYPESPNNHMSHFPFLQNEQAVALISRFQNSDKDTLILSDENLYRTHWEKAQRFWRDLSASEYDILAVMYVRPQPIWIQSIYQQYVTQWDHRYAGDIYSFISRFSIDLNYFRHVRFLQALGIQVQVRSYDYALSTGGSVSDFLKVLEIEHEPQILEAQANPSMGRSAVEVVREMNRMGLIVNKDKYDALINHLKNRTGNSSRFGFLSQSDCDDLWARFGVGNERLRDFMPKEHYDRFTKNNWPDAYRRDYFLPEITTIVADIWREFGGRN